MKKYIGLILVMLFFLMAFIHLVLSGTYTANTSTFDENFTEFSGVNKTSSVNITHINRSIKVENENVSRNFDFDTDFQGVDNNFSNFCNLNISNVSSINYNGSLSFQNNSFSFLQDCVQFKAFNSVYDAMNTEIWFYDDNSSNMSLTFRVVSTTGTELIESGIFSNASLSNYAYRGFNRCGNGDSIAITTVPRRNNSWVQLVMDARNAETLDMKFDGLTVGTTSCGAGDSSTIRGKVIVRANCSYPCYVDYFRTDTGREMNGQFKSTLINDSRNINSVMLYSSNSSKINFSVCDKRYLKCQNLEIGNTSISKLNGLTTVSNMTSGSILYNYSMIITISPLVDGENPKYLGSQTNISSTKTGQTVQWGVNLTDDVELDTYYFAHNQTGTLTNGSLKILNSTSQNVNETISVTLTRGKNICGQFTFFDTSDKFNQTTLLCGNVQNTPPVVNTTPDVSLKHTSNLSIVINATDADSDVLAYYDNSTMINITSSGYVDHNATINDIGNRSINVSVDDGFENASFIFWYNITNSKPVPNDVKINNTPILTNDANGSTSYSDLENDTQVSISFQWFVNGTLNQTGDNSSSFLGGNYSSGSSLIVGIRVYDGFDWSGWVNSSNVTVGDATPPLIPNMFLLLLSLTNAAGNTNNFTINSTDLSSNIQTINFSLNRSDNTNIDRSFTVPANQKSVNITYSIFSVDETLTVGNYNISTVRACDGSNNCNRTTDAASFPGWAGFSFTVTAAGGGGDGGDGGGGGGGCDAGFTNVGGVCIPTSNVTANLTRAPRCGDTFCDAFAGEDIFSCPVDCPLNKVRASYLTCSDPTEPCFFKTQKVVAYAIGFIIGGGVLFLSVSKGGKGKDILKKVKKWLKEYGEG